MTWRACVRACVRRCVHVWVRVVSANMDAISGWQYVCPYHAISGVVVSCNITQSSFISLARSFVCLFVCLFVWRMFPRNGYVCWSVVAALDLNLLLVFLRHCHINHKVVLTVPYWEYFLPSLCVFSSRAILWYCTFYTEGSDVVVSPSNWSFRGNTKLCHFSHAINAFLSRLHQIHRFILIVLLLLSLWLLLLLLLLSSS